MSITTKVRQKSTGLVVEVTTEVDESHDDALRATLCALRRIEPPKPPERDVRGGGFPPLP